MRLVSQFKIGQTKLKTFFQYNKVCSASEITIGFAIKYASEVLTEGNADLEALNDANEVITFFLQNGTKEKLNLTI